MTAIACPTCGSTYWKRVTSGNYTADEWVETDQPSAIIEEEDIGTDRMDSTPWHCGNDHEANDETNDRLAGVDG